MNLNDEYFKLCYTERIHEFSKIDSYQNLDKGQSRTKYRSLNEFYLDELQIEKDKLNELRNEFKQYDELLCSQQKATKHSSGTLLFKYSLRSFKNSNSC